MDKQQLKEKIKKKFRSVSRFARLAGIDPVFLIEQLRGGRKMTEYQYNMLELAVKNIKDKPIPGVDITPELRDQIRDAINKKYSSISDFCRRHNLDIPWVSKIINDVPSGAKKRTKYVDNLIKILKIEEK
jgi:hypothetical protein